MNNKMPKRRKSKDNPYTVLYCKETDKHYLSFQDGQGTKHCFEINETLYNAFDSFELEDLSRLNEYDRHIEHLELTEASLNKRALQKPKTIVEVVYERIRNEQLHCLLHVFDKRVNAGKDGGK